MSIEGYFDGIIEIWNKQEHPTPCMIEDMKTVLKQFNFSKVYEDISEDRLQDLTESFERIEKEITQNVDTGFWDKNGVYQKDIQKVYIDELSSK